MRARRLSAAAWLPFVTLLGTLARSASAAPTATSDAAPAPAPGEPTGTLAFGEPTTSAVGEPIEAQPMTTDGLYGRLKSEWSHSLGVGAGVRGEHLGVALRASLYWLWSVGAVVEYQEDLSRNARHLSPQLELRPLFLQRWSNNQSRGPALLDLTLDSLALSVGAVFDWTPEASTALQAALSAGVPLTGSAAGPWLLAKGGLQLAPWRSGWEPAPMALLVLDWQCFD